MKKFYLLLAFSTSVVLGCQKKAEEKTNAAVEKKDSLYVVKAFNQELTVNAKNGARITSLQTEGKEIIGTGGSTFWSSPQSAWGWPPVKSQHDLPYTGEVKGDTLILKSSKDDQLGLGFTKTIFANAKDSSFTVLYTITNNNDSVVKVAPWENTRAFKKALVFYPKGETDSTAFAEVMGDLKLSNSNGINWFIFDSSRILEKPMAKLFADGEEGWLAQSYNNLVLIKKFKPLSRAEQAPGEGEIEVFSDLSNDFTEVEQQGPYTEIQPKGNLQWEVKWYLRPLPAGVQAQEGNAALVEFVRKTVKQ